LPYQNVFVGYFGELYEGISYVREKDSLARAVVSNEHYRSRVPFRS